MMGSTILIFFSMTTMAVVCNNVLVAALPNHCNPGFLDELAPRIRKVYAALCRIYELDSEMKSYYIDDKENRITGFRDGIPLLDSGVKRQDVDHYFLRFGRRR